jgi:hypothetical protein
MPHYAKSIQYVKNFVGIIINMKETLCWRISISTSAVLLLLLILLWWWADSSYHPNVSQAVDEKSVHQFLDDLSASIAEPPTVKPIYLPTGVFLESVKFVNANDVQVSGYIWQVYHDDVHAGLSRDFVLPEIVDSAGTARKEVAYSRRIGKQQVIGWYIEATLRQKFVYSKYPFDHKTFWLRLWHKDFDRNIVLIPDFKSYTQRTNLGDIFWNQERYCA